MADRDLLLRLAGPILASYLDDGNVTEIMINDNHTAFLNRYGLGMSEVDHPDKFCQPGHSHMDNFLSALAHEARMQWNDEHCQMGGALEDMGWRFEAGRPPASPGIYMSLRKHPTQIFPLDDYEAKGILTHEERRIIETAMRQRKRIVISGAVGSAKTSLVNALLDSIKDTTDRIIICEDDPEIHCEVRNCTYMRVVKEKTTLYDNVKRCLRLFPSRIVVGEVRGGEALEMLKAFMTGHSGITTVHAEDAESTMDMLEQRVLEASKDPQSKMIGKVVDLIVHMEKWGNPPWRCTGILALEGYRNGEYVFKMLAGEKYQHGQRREQLEQEEEARTGDRQSQEAQRHTLTEAVS